MSDHLQQNRMLANDRDFPGQSRGRSRLAAAEVSPKTGRARRPAGENVSGSQRLQRSHRSQTCESQRTIALSSVEQTEPPVDPLRDEFVVVDSSRIHLPTMRSVEEEIANTLTHGVGLGLAVAGWCVLLVFASLEGSVWSIVGCGIYGATLVMLYAASTFYHSVTSPRWKPTLRLCDHMCIFLLIAGTYTPFLLTTLRGPWGWTLLALVWTCAIAGILFKLYAAGRFRSVSAAPYLGMGWLVVLAAKPLLQLMPVGGLLWLLGGGLFYSAGTIFYRRDHNRYYHAVWHIFVLLGSVCHFCAVFFYATSA